MLDRIASKRIQKSCIDHQEFFKLSQDNRNLNPTISQYHKQSSLTNNHQNNLNDPLRPNPSLVRVSSKRIKSASQQKQCIVKLNLNKICFFNKINHSAIALLFSFLDKSNSLNIFLSSRIDNFW